jgi:outer membrane cobalamin receptor
MVTLGDRWSAVATLSLERLDVRHVESPGLEDGERGRAPLRTLVSPQVELRYRVTSGVVTSLSVYERSRFPTFRQMYGTRPPNPDLEPQRTTGIGLGVRWAVGESIEVGGDLFSDRVRELISRSSRYQPFENQDEADIMGLELSADGNHRRLAWTVGLTVMDTEFVESVEGMLEVPSVPETAAEASVRLPLQSRFEIRAGWRYEGRRVIYDFGNRVELDPFSWLRLGGSVRLHDFEILAEVDNLLDADIEQEPGFPLEGRRLWLGVRFTTR